MPTINENKTSETRVLVFMPTGRDALLICRTLENVGIAAQSCVNFQQVEENIELGAGALLIAEEALAKGTLEKIIESFENQPIWSDLPMIIFASKAINSEKLLTIVGTRLNATIVERPIRIAMLISAVRGALRARQRQYQSRNLLNQLKESDHQKDMFLATLSHELRTPLNSILGWTQVLRNKSSAVDVGHGLEVIERNAKAQTEIISDILFVSRIITGKLFLYLPYTIWRYEIQLSVSELKGGTQNRGLPFPFDVLIIVLLIVTIMGGRVENSKNYEEIFQNKW